MARRCWCNILDSIGGASAGSGCAQLADFDILMADLRDRRMIVVKTTASLTASRP